MERRKGSRNNLCWVSRSRVTKGGDASRIWADPFLSFLLQFHHRSRNCRCLRCRSLPLHQGELQSRVRVKNHQVETDSSSSSLFPVCGPRPRELRLHGSLRFASLLLPRHRRSHHEHRLQGQSRNIRQTQKDSEFDRRLTIPSLHLLFFLRDRLPSNSTSFLRLLSPPPSWEPPPLLPCKLLVEECRSRPSLSPASDLFALPLLHFQPRHALLAPLRSR